MYLLKYPIHGLPLVMARATLSWKIFSSPKNENNELYYFEYLILPNAKSHVCVTLYCSKLIISILLIQSIYLHFTLQPCPISWARVKFDYSETMTLIDIKEPNNVNFKTQ